MLSILQLWQSNQRWVEVEPARPYEESIRKMEQEKYELYGR